MPALTDIKTEGVNIPAFWNPYAWFQIQEASVGIEMLAYKDLYAFRYEQVQLNKRHHQSTGNARALASRSGT